MWHSFLIQNTFGKVGGFERFKKHLKTQKLKIMNIHNILSQDAFWTVNKALARAVGVESALLLSDLITKEKYFGDRGMLDQEGYFFNTIENIEADTTLPRRAQKVCIDILISNKLIDHKLKGMPAKRSFRINHLEIFEFIKAADSHRLYETYKHDCTKRTSQFVQNEQTSLYETYNTNKNKVNKNKEISLLLEKEAKENFQNNQDLKEDSIPSTSLNTQQDEIAPGGAAKKSKFGKAEFREELILLGADEEIVNDWFSARDKKKLAYTKTALNGFLNECKKHNIPIYKAVEISATNGWGGFKYEWTDEFKRLNQNPKPYPNGTNQAKPSGPKIGRVSVSKLEEVYRANTTNTSS